MSPALVLFVLRLVSALLLLAFFGLMAYLLYRDLRSVAGVGIAQPVNRGRLVRLGVDDGPVDQHALHAITSIGRSPGNTLVIEDDFASGEHALVTLRGQQWWLEDLNSRNGTLLNDLPLEAAAVVSSGDVITVGRTRFRLEI